MLRSQREQVAAASQQLCGALYCSRLHAQVFPGLRGSLSGQNVALLGGGPTLRQAPPLDGCLIATCNSSHGFVKGRSDFYFAIDHQEVNRAVIAEALRTLPPECRIYLGCYLSPYVTLNMQLPRPLRCDPRVTSYCSDAGIQPRPELELFPVYQCGTITHNMLHILLYAGAAVIYLLGCDVQPSGYFDDRVNPRQQEMPVEALRSGYAQLRALQQQHFPHTRIISVNPLGLRGLFEDAYTPAFLSLHPELRTGAQVIETL